MVHPPFRWQRNYAKDFVTGIWRMADETDVRFAVENMYPWRYRDREMLAYAPDWDVTNDDYRHFTVDLSHTATARTDSLAMVDRMGDRLAHVHLADGKGSAKDEHLVPGRGDQPCAELLERLARTSFDGHVVIEVNTRRAMSSAEREADLAEALAFTRLHLASAPAPRTRPPPSRTRPAEPPTRPLRPAARDPGPSAPAPGLPDPGPPVTEDAPAPGAGAAPPARPPPKAPTPVRASCRRPVRSSPSAATTRPRSARSPRPPGSTRPSSTTTSVRRTRSSRPPSSSPSNRPSSSPQSSAAPGGPGERLARYFLSVWENPATRAPLLAVLRSALTHEAAAKVLRGFVLRRLLERIAADLDVPDATFRAELAASHMIGIAMLRYVIRAEPLASADPEDIVAMVAPTLQRYLTES